MLKDKIELFCSADVVPHLGAQTLSEHRKLHDAEYLLVRDHETMSQFFWPWIEHDVPTAVSS